MHTHRVDVLHITYCDAVSSTVPHHLILDLFPTGDAPLYQHLSHTRQTQPIFQNFPQLKLIVRDASAAAAQSISRAQYHRITNRIGEFHTFLNGSHHLRGSHGLSDFLHGIFEFLTIFRFLDRL